MPKKPALTLAEHRPETEAFYQEFISLMKKHTGHMQGIEVLAIVSNIIGKLIAMQDQRTITQQMAMECVIANLELGNQEMIAELSGETKGNA